MPPPPSTTTTSPSPRPTHFLALTTSTPLTSHPTLPSTLQTLYTTLLHPSPTQSYPPLPLLTLRPLRTLHLTLCVLHLPTQNHITTLLTALKGWKDSFSTTSTTSTNPPIPQIKPIPTTLSGISTFPTQSLRTCRVLYIPPHSHSPGELSELARRVREVVVRCEGRGGMVLSREEEEVWGRYQLAIADADAGNAGDAGGASGSNSTLHLSLPPILPPPTLHMTVMNNTYAKPRGGHGHGHGRGRGRGGGSQHTHRGRGGSSRGGSSGITFGSGANRLGDPTTTSGGGEFSPSGYDLRGIVEEFKDTVWAEEVVFDRIELMRMGEVKVKGRNLFGEEIEEGREVEEGMDAYYESVGYVEL